MLQIPRLDLSEHPGRVFVLGDLHGMSHLLEALLSAAAFDAGADLLWSLGDLVDRGPFSPRCLELLDEPWFRAIRGNHEQMMLDAVDDPPSLERWIMNGGEWCADYPWNDPALRARLEALPWAAELKTRVGRIGLVHADVNPGMDWGEFVRALDAGVLSARETALWSRRTAYRAFGRQPGRHLDGADLVLVGHSIVDKNLLWGNFWFLDTGAVVSDEPTAALTMLEVHPVVRVWSLPTAGDPTADQWWSGHAERLDAALSLLDEPDL